MNTPAMLRSVARTCYGCGKLAAADQTEAARRRPYACLRCLERLSDRMYVPAWVEEALDELVTAR